MSKERILVVEDEPLVGEELREDLENLGYVVPELLASGDEIAEAVNRHKPDLVLMDIRLEGSADGIDTAYRLKADFDIPIIYLTAYSDPETLARAALTSPAAYLIKPFNERELAANVALALNSSSRSGSRGEGPSRAGARRAERERLRDNEPLLDALDLPAVLLRPDGLISYANAQARSLFGVRDVAEIRDRPLASFVDLGEVPVEGGETLRLIVSADGDAQRLVLRTEGLFDKEGTRFGSLVLLDRMSGKERSLLESSADSLNAALLSSLAPRDAAGPGYEVGGFLLPCPSGSGDVFDVLHAGPDRFCFFGLDVMGHGSLATLIAWQLRDLIRRVVAREWTIGPRELLARVNARFLEGDFGADPLFFSIALGFVERRSGRYSLVRAGHPPLLVVEPTGPARVLRGEGQVLGVNDLPEMEEREGILAPGARLVVFSDGLLEAFERQGHDLQAFVRMVESHRGQEVSDFSSLMREMALEGFSSDDASFLVIERRL